MPALESPSVVLEVSRNDLAYLQLEIARRADQLARGLMSDRPTDLELWLQAEREVFGRHFSTCREA